MTELAKSLLKVQQEAPKLQASAVNPHFKNRYVPLEELLEKVLPLLNDNNLVLAQVPAHIDGAPALRSTITHAETGEELSGITPLILDKPTMQGYGSANTYARRFAVMSMLGLVADKDDDGAAASPAREAQPSAGEKPVLAGTAKQIGMNVQLLDRAFPEHPGEGRTWQDEAVAHIRDRYEKESVRDLSEAEAVALNDWLEGRFNEAMSNQNIPFDPDSPADAEVKASA